MLARKPYTARTETPVGQIVEFLVADKKFPLAERLTIDKRPARLFHGWHTLQELAEMKKLSEQRKWRSLLRRLEMAVLGGVLLVVPVVIMSFETSRTRSLITLSAAVMIFALVVAVLAVKGSAYEILAATAGYAAVLSVFLGVSVGSPVGQ